MQYESTFNAIDNILRNESGCSTELDNIEQTSWMFTSNPEFWGGDICWISPAELHGEHYLYDSVNA